MMKFLSRFFGSMYSAALYRQLRTQESGYGMVYSTHLLLLQAVLAFGVLGFLTPDKKLATLLASGDANMPLAILMILLVAIILRLVMLFSLAVAARLIALIWKLPMDYAAAFRVAALAYTPVALMDMLAFAMIATALAPWLLFGLGVGMLFAVLYASRGV